MDETRDPNIGDVWVSQTTGQVRLITGSSRNVLYYQSRDPHTGEVISTQSTMGRFAVWIVYDHASRIAEDQPMSYLTDVPL